MDSNQNLLYISRGVLPIELYTRKVDTLIIFAVYVFKMAGYSGVEPLRGDRQSPVLTDIRIPRKNQDTCYINFVAIIYKIAFIDNRWDRTNKHQRFMFAVRIFKIKFNCQRSIIKLVV